MEKTLTNALAAIKNLAFPAFGFFEGVTTDIFWWAAGFAIFFGLLAWLIRPSGEPSQFAAPWLSMLILFYFVSIMMRDFTKWVTAYVGFMGEAGTNASGFSAHGLEDISAVVENGWNASAALWKALNGFWIPFQTGSFLIICVCIAFVLVGHCILAYRLIKLFGEFYILSVITFLVLPFAVWRMTLFMAEGPAKYIISTGISIAAIGFGYGLTHALIGAIVYDPAMMAGWAFGQSFAMLILLLIVAGLPSGIRSYMHGNANSNFGGEARNMIMTATTAASAARIAMAMAPAAGAAGGGAGSLGGGGSLPGGITFNPNFRPGASTGSPGGATATLTNAANATRTTP